MTQLKIITSQSADHVLQSIISAVTESYNTPDGDPSSPCTHRSIVQVAEEFSITPLEVRKLLITGGAFETSISRHVNELYNSGKTIEEIQEITKLKAASIHSYLPYRRGLYNTIALSEGSERIRLYYARKEAVERLVNENSAGKKSPRELVLLWNAISLFADYPFRKNNRLRFTYKIKNNDIIVNNEYMISRYCAEEAYKHISELRSGGNNVTGDAVIEDVMYSIFVRFQLISDNV